ncbi:12121_t:CDS:2 [Acaulospora morrowiae]|uniref:12121_t:CDS:1 n=1 Tax=Acaulospora morrowiae TaxID=94023 RepID=A0A9N8WEW8_9GLOM|nr:12121_t:CDS:2 [Acaulospora morrowiae]
MAIPSSNQCSEQTNSRASSLPHPHQKSQKTLRKSRSTSSLTRKLNPSLSSQLFFPYTVNHVNDVKHKGNRLIETNHHIDSDRISISVTKREVKRHHSRRHTVDYTSNELNLEKRNTNPPENVRCCNLSVVKELNVLSGKTVTVKRKDGKKFVVKCVDKKKLLKDEYYKNAHSGTCDCKNCQDPTTTSTSHSISSLIRGKFLRKKSVASDTLIITSAAQKISQIRFNSSPALASIMEDAPPPKYVNDKIPLELLLLTANSTELPEFVTYFSNDDYYYYVTKMHGVKQRKWKKPRSWRCKKYFDVFWDDYISKNVKCVE